MKKSKTSVHLGVKIMKKSPIQKLIEFDALRVSLGKTPIFDQNKPCGKIITQTKKSDNQAN